MGPGSIVVGLDGSPAAASALRWAAKRAADTKAELGVIHVYEHRGRLGMSGRALGAARETDARARATLWVTGSLGRGAHTVGVRVEVAEGSPARVLTSVSQGADLLVLGAPIDDRLHRLVSGSVARRCSVTAHCPVVLVPPDGQS